MKPSALTVAAVQVACQLGDRDGNLANATKFIEQAARQDAKLVLLPELVPGGYTLNETIWDTAEPFDGPSTQWMRALSKRLDIYLGTTFLEAKREDFYNTFVLTGPGGEVVACVRKSPPASFEAYFIAGGSDCHWFDTPIGRIGVGICFENALYERYAELHQAQIDLYLRPFSGASFDAKFPFRQRDVDLLNAALREGTAETARSMGIPVVMSNKVGRLVSTLPAGFPPQDMEFPGFSAVADSDGSLLGQLGRGEQGIVAGTVHLLSERKSKELVPRSYGRWTAKMPWWAFIFVLTQRMGEKAYAKSARRKSKALEASKTPNPSFQRTAFGGR